MFEELLIAKEKIDIRKNIYGSHIYQHPDLLFEIRKEENNKWRSFCGENLVEYLNIPQLAEMWNVSEHSFPTLKQARKYFLDQVKSFINKKEMEVFCQNLVAKKENWYHDINCEEYPYTAIKSPLALVGKMNCWEFIIEPDDYLQKSCLDYMFVKKFQTRPQALKEMYQSITLNLDKLYYETGPKKYQQFKTYYSLLNSFQPEILESHIGWWIIFTKSDINLQQIF